MCGVDQERGVEERNKRRTFKYYCRLIEASKTGKGIDVFVFTVFVLISAQCA